MSYHVQVTNEAEKDIFAALDYIEDVLYNPQAAADLAVLVEQTILSLDVLSTKQMSKAPSLIIDFGEIFTPPP